MKVNVFSCLILIMFSTSLSAMTADGDYSISNPSNSAVKQIKVCMSGTYPLLHNFDDNKEYIVIKGASISLEIPDLFNQLPRKDYYSLAEFTRRVLGNPMGNKDIPTKDIEGGWLRLDGYYVLNFPNKPGNFTLTSVKELHPRTSAQSLIGLELKEESLPKEESPSSLKTFTLKSMELGTDLVQQKNGLELILRDPNLSSKLRSVFESLKVEDLYGSDTQIKPEKGSQVIRRSWKKYADTYQKRQVVFCSGHNGQHSGIYGTSKGQQFYMVDQCWEEVGPDAVLDMNKPLHWRYFPDNSLDLVVIDDYRFFPNEMIPHAFPLLKKGGKLVFQPGDSIGWPSVNLFKTGAAQVEFDVSGRYAWANSGYNHALRRTPNLRNGFEKEAVEKAQKYYGEMGFSHVDYDTRHKVFVLTK